LMVSKLRGVDLGLDSCIKVAVEGCLPGGERITRNARIPTAAAFICVKAIAMQERAADKDAYDIYFCLAHDPGGPESLGRACAELRDLHNVKDAVEALRTDFSAVDRNGPVWAGRFAATHGADPEVVKRDAFERARALVLGYDKACEG